MLLFSTKAVPLKLNTQYRKGITITTGLSMYYECDKKKFRREFRQKNSITFLLIYR